MLKIFFLQAAAYAEAYNYLNNTNINKLVILITVQNASVQAFYGNRINYLPELKYRINMFNKLKREIS